MGSFSFSFPFFNLKQKSLKIISETEAQNKMTQFPNWKVKLKTPRLLLGLKEITQGKMGSF